jgi:hypothetical protein
VSAYVKLAYRDLFQDEPSFVSGVPLPAQLFKFHESYRGEVLSQVRAAGADPQLNLRGGG